MSGHRSFEALRAGMSPDRRVRNRDASEVLGEELTLNELRAMRRQSQKDVAGVMNVLQPAVAKLERRGDMYVSNLARFVEALGGRLVVTAQFPEQSVTLKLGGVEGGDPSPTGHGEIG